MSLPDALPPLATPADACERVLREAILRGDLAPGERLPPERELAARYGLNRLTLRSALGRLASARLIRSRQGSGHVVSDFLREGGPDLLGGLLSQDGQPSLALLRELLRVRRHLARAVLEAIAEREEPPELEPVRGAVARFAAAVTAEADPARLAAADLEVLVAVLEASGSPVLRLCLNPVVAVLRDVPALRAAIYAEPAANLAGWEALLAWLEAPDPGAVELLVAVLAERDADALARLARRPRPR